MRYKTILLFGPPGSGKGTQGKVIGALPGFHHCACGDVFRALDPHSEMGQLFAGYAKNGALVPDELTIELWRQTIHAMTLNGKFDPASQILLLDGIPRTVRQAELLDDKIDVTGIVNLLCNNVSEIVARLQKRAAIGKRADDTNEEVIRYRIEVYDEQTRPVLDHYPRSRVYPVNATRELQEVTGDIMKVLSSLSLIGGL